MPLDPAALVSTGPVTVTVSGRNVVIEGFVSDTRGTRMAVRMVDVERPSENAADEQRSLTLYPMTGDAQFGRNDDQLSCTISTDLIRTQECTVPPFSAAQRRRGDAGFYVAPAHPIGNLGVQYPGQPFDWNPELLQANVQLAEVAEAGLPRAHRLGAAVVRGGLSLQGWAAEADGGRLAVRIDAVGVPTADYVHFTTRDHEPTRDIALVHDGRPELRPTQLFTHYDPENDGPSGMGFRLPVPFEPEPAGMVTETALPVTAVFAVPTDRDAVRATVRVGQLAWKVDEHLSPHDDPFEALDGASLVVRTAGRQIWDGAIPPWIGWNGLDYPASFPLMATLRFADASIQIDRGMLRYSTGDNGTPELGRPRSLLLNWRQASDGDRVLQSARVGLITSSLWSWPPFRRICDVIGGDLVSDGNGDRRVFVELGKERPDSVEVCFVQPVFVVRGPWTMPLSSP
ncbi:MAG: hypothetical protein ABI780_04435 [Ardenticatenales bacterium]